MVGYERIVSELISLQFNILFYKNEETFRYIYSDIYVYPNID